MLLRPGLPVCSLRILVHLMAVITAGTPSSSAGSSIHWALFPVSVVTLLRPSAPVSVVLYNSAERRHTDAGPGRRAMSMPGRTLPCQPAAEPVCARGQAPVRSCRRCSSSSRASTWGPTSTRPGCMMAALSWSATRGLMRRRVQQASRTGTCLRLLPHFIISVVYGASHGFVCGFHALWQFCLHAALAHCAGCAVNCNSTQCLDANIGCASASHALCKCASALCFYCSAYLEHAAYQ